MRSFAAPKVRSERNCRFKQHPGGRTLNAAKPFCGPRTELRIAQRALGN